MGDAGNYAFLEYRVGLACGGRGGRSALLPWTGEDAEEPLDRAAAQLRGELD